MCSEDRPHPTGRGSAAQAAVSGAEAPAPRAAGCCSGLSLAWLSAAASRSSSPWLSPWPPFPCLIICCFSAKGLEGRKAELTQIMGGWQEQGLYGEGLTQELRHLAAVCCRALWACVPAVLCLPHARLPLGGSSFLCGLNSAYSTGMGFACLRSASSW